MGDVEKAEVSEDTGNDTDQLSRQESPELQELCPISVNPHASLQVERKKNQQELDLQESTATICREENFGNSLLPKFCDLWKTGKFCDVTFLVGTDKIRCHRMVLASVSSFFQKTFNEKIQVGETIEVRNVTAEVFRSIVEFAYTGQIELQDSNVQSLLVACRFFQIESLLCVCENFASKSIAASNCFDVLSFSRNMSLQRLEANTVRFIETRLEQLLEDNDVCENNIESIFQCFLNKDICLMRKYLPLNSSNRHLYLLQLVIMYLVHNPALADDIPRLFQRINLLLIPLKTLQITVMKEPLLKDNALVQHMLELVCLKTFGSNSSEVPDSWTFMDDEQNNWRFYHSDVVANVKQALDSSLKLLTFNDLTPAESDTHLQTIELIFRPWDTSMVVGGMTLRYSNNKSITHGMRHLPTSCERHIIELEEGELITAVTVSAGWVTNRLKFFTNKNRDYGPYGGWGGSEITWKCPSGKFNHLHGFHGCIRLSKMYPAFFTLNAIWACYKDKNAREPNH